MWLVYSCLSSEWVILVCLQTSERVFDTKWCISLNVTPRLSVFPPSETTLVSDFTSHFVAMSGLTLDFSEPHTIKL